MAPGKQHQDPHHCPEAGAQQTGTAPVTVAGVANCPSVQQQHGLAPRAPASTAASCQRPHACSGPAQTRAGLNKAKQERAALPLSSMHRQAPALAHAAASGRPSVTAGSSLGAGGRGTTHNGAEMAEKQRHYRPRQAGSSNPASVVPRSAPPRCPRGGGHSPTEGSMPAGSSEAGMSEALSSELGGDPHTQSRAVSAVVLGATALAFPTPAP